jgi:hypothetical protein
LVPLECGKRVASHHSFHFSLRVEVKELLDADVATARSNEYLILLHFDVNLLRSELVDAFALPHEQLPLSISILSIIDEGSQFLVDSVLLDGYVCDATLSHLQNQAFKIIVVLLCFLS